MDALEVFKLIWQTNPGCILPWLCLIPGLVSKFDECIMFLFKCYSMLFEVGSRLIILVPYYKPNIPGIIVSLLLLLFWLFLLGYLIGWIDKNQMRCRIRTKRRTGSRRQKVRRFRRRSLPFFLVMRCRNRGPHNAPPEIDNIYGYVVVTKRYTPQDRQHIRWRRRQRSSKERARKRIVLNHEKFLTPKKSSHKYWNEHRVVDAEFLSDASMDSFQPHAEYGLVPEEVLNMFVAGRGDTFLAAARLRSKFKSADQLKGAEEVVRRLNHFRVVLGLDSNNKKSLKRKRSTFKNCPLVWDTGASFGLTPFRNDFIDYIECSIPVNDIARTNIVVGIGTTLHKFDMNGEAVYLPCLSYHLPSAEVRLFSPQTYHTLYGGHSTVFGDRVVKLINDMSITIPIDERSGNVPMVMKPACTPKEIREIGPHIRSALPHYERKVDFFGSWSEDNFANWGIQANVGVGDVSLPNIALEDNQNLSSAQKELLLWHWKLGISMQHIQELMKVAEMKEPNGAVSVKDRVIVPKLSSAATCDIPVCQSCELSRAKQRKAPVVKAKVNESSEGAISRDQYQPGDFVSIDQYVVKTPGRLPTGFGQESEQNMYHGGTIFRDAASKYIHVSNQVSLGAGETVLSKRNFEDWLWEEARLRIKHYHSDNGVFTAELFTDACKEDGQTQSFSGVGAQHQNAEAERAIQTVVYMARSFMIHAALNWGEDGSDDVSLWSFALDHASWLYNRVPQRRSGITPMEMTTSVMSDHRDLARTHVWGCPCYVLEPKLQNNQKLPKWNRRARMGQFLGFSRVHSSTVALVRNLHTGFVSPQYHVVFDDKFETVFNDGRTDEELDRICEELFAGNKERYVEEEYDRDGILVYEPPPLDEVWLSEPERRDRRDALEKQRRRTECRERERASEEIKRNSDRDPCPPLAESDVESDDDSQPDVFSPDFKSGGEDVVDEDLWTDHPSVQGDEPAQVETEESSASEEVKPTEEALGRGPDGRSRRDRGDRPNYKDSLRPSSYKCHLGEKQIPPGVRRLSTKKLRYRKRMALRRREGDDMLLRAEGEQVPSVETLMASPLSNFIHFAANDCGYSGTRLELIANWIHPLFLKAKSEASSEDNPNWRQAMNGPFREEYWEAACKEVETLESMDAWEVVDRTPEMNVIDSIWAFRLKRFPDGMIKKFKARFCARGDQQLAGVDFFETYAPVVQWTTVRLMLILEILLNLKSKQGDVTAAFLHADLGEDENVYVEMPLGFRKKGKVLSLKKTLYGLRQSPREFWKYLTKAMEACDMKPSKFDPCLFIGERVIAVAFVDDILFWSTDEAYINKLGAKLREQGLLLEQEDDAAGFLGVTMTKTEGGHLELKQTGLIDRIVEALGLDQKMATPKWTPAEAKPLTKDEDGEMPQGSFNYSSVVGMLLYLSGHSRPDIAYAVNCCARYMFSPRLSHEKALKQIGRYLKATRDRGLVMKPTGKLNVDAYPDADFAGLYGYEKPSDPACTKSRTGFCITVSDCPLCWMSKIQRETAASTMEAEINALAHCCRELFPVIDVVGEVGSAVGLSDDNLKSMHVSVHEDNAGALILAETIPPQFTPRSKYYAIKTVWFREEINKRGIKLFKIDTKEQLGDIFTKGLPRATFEYLRMKLMGW